MRFFLANLFALLLSHGRTYCSFPVCFHLWPGRGFLLLTVQRGEAMPAIEFPFTERWRGIILLENQDMGTHPKPSESESALRHDLAPMQMQIEVWAASSMAAVVFCIWQFSSCLSPYVEGQAQGQEIEVRLSVCFNSTFWAYSHLRFLETLTFIKGDQANYRKNFIIWWVLHHFQSASRSHMIFSRVLEC